MKKFSADHFLNLISDAYPGLIAYIDKDLKYEFANKQYSSWFGVGAEEIVGKTVEEVIGLENYLKRSPYLAKAFGGEQVKFLTSLKHKTLGLRDVEQVYRPDFAADGTLQGVIALAYDITEQKKLERLARENEARFHLLTENIPQLVWISDQDGKLIWYNKNSLRYYGQSLGAYDGDAWLKVIHPDDMQAAIELWQAKLRSLEPATTEYRMKMADGSYRWHMVHAAPIIEEGNPIRWVGITTDIEEQKSAKDIADAERKKILKLFMQAPIVMTVTMGPEHVFELVNPKTYKFYPERQLLGKPMKEAMPENIEQGFIKIMDDIYASGKGRSFISVPFKSLQPDGTMAEFYSDIFYEPIKDDQGKTIGILSLGVDVTDQVLALKKAQASENLFRTYVDSMPQMAYMADSSGQITYLNKRWDEFSDLSFADPKSWAEFIHPDDMSETVDRWMKSIKEGTFLQGEYRLKRKDGVYRWHLLRGVPLRDELGGIIQWVGTNTDIHDQKEFETYQSRLLQVLESSSDFIGMADKQGKAIYLNSAAKTLVGLDDLGPEIGHLKIEDFFMPEDLPYLRDVILPSTLNKGKWVGDFRFRNFKTGNPIWVHYNSFTTHDEVTGEFTGYATVTRDITELKHKELKLEEALKARDHFLSIASHELKTPLTSLKLQSQFVLRILGHDKTIPPERQASMARQTDELVDRLTHLIDDMLDVSRINTGKLRLEKKEHELGDIVREVLFRMSGLFEEAKLSMPILAVNGKFVGLWDRFRIEQVVGNLLTNAIRYGQGKTIEIHIRQEQADAILSVTDQGYGIAKEDQNRIFERFERAMSSAEVSGLGLGLYISKEIVEAHSGKIWVESDVNQGSTFFVRLPLKV